MAAPALDTVPPAAGALGVVDVLAVFVALAEGAGLLAVLLGFGVADAEVVADADAEALAEPVGAAD